MQAGMSVVAVAAMTYSAAAQVEIFRQDPIAGCSGPSSQDARNVGGLGWFSEVADDFPMSSGDAVTLVGFWGGYCTTEPGDTQGFTVRFYSNDDGVPGTLMYEEDVFDFSEIRYFLNGQGLEGFEYFLELPSAFAPGAGTYWVSIVAILDRGGDAMQPQWGINEASNLFGGNAQSWFMSPGDFAPLTHGMAFALLGPEPCLADLTGSSDPNDPSYGVPDGVVEAADFFYFLDQFVAGNLDGADLTGSSDPNDAAYGVPDGVLDGSDFFYYLDRFVEGCP